MTKRSLIALSVLLIIVSVGIFVQRSVHAPAPETPPATPTPTQQPETVPIEIATTSVTTLGTSVEGRPIQSYHFGTGSTSILFVGGIHGGYEWNSSALAYEFITAFQTGVLSVPPNITITIIPTLNPDGLYKVAGIEGSFTAADVPPTDTHTTGEGRFNARGVDLNRNFDCKWQPESTWRNKPVSAGIAPFSEPEATALLRLVEVRKPAAAIFWHSQGGAVYGSACEAGILPQTLVLMKTYAAAAAYDEIPLFDAYPITGDAEGWLASIGIPAVTVELATRTTTEWERNKSAMEAVLSRYEQN